MIPKLHLVIIGLIAGMNATDYKYNDNHRIIIPDQKEINLLPLDGGSMWNRLIFEKSPYLLQHAANPVNWYPWSQEAFEIASNENKPIFLSIGYTTCHWCHVMEHESFEDADVAEMMNETFINIKVDREERPDIDNIYMEVTQMINGRGGWPMTVIMTPDKKPFFAGTYFPKESRYNRVGMKELVPQINDLWKTKNDSIINSAEKITSTLIDRNINRNKKSNIDNNELFLSAFNTFNKNFDSEYGGFKGSRNKFPKPHDYSFLIRYYNRTDNKKALDIVNKSLYSMKMGGLYDQIGFGFHRYSTDPKWLVPHFEKMLYDQAMLIHAYLDAYLITKDNFFKETVDEIIEYVIRDMTSDNGGFYSAEDADSQGEEGLFYIWDYDQLSIALGKDNNTENLKFISDILNVNKNGNCRVEGHNTNIPYFKNTWEEISNSYNSDVSLLKIKFQKLRNKIFENRNDRVHPQKDDKILTDWNGLMIAAVSRAGAIFDNQHYLKVAEKSADFIINNLKSSDGGLLKRYRQGVSGIEGMIEDYAFLIWGLIELYQSTLKEKYILEAVRLSDYQFEHFWDNDNGGFFFTSNTSEKLLIRNKEIYDGAIPSGNSVSAYNYIRLGRIMSRPDFEKVSFDIIESFSNNLKRYSSGYTMLLHAIDFIEGPSYEVVVSGNKNKSKDILSYLYNNEQLNKVIIFNPASNKKRDKQFNFLGNYKSGENNNPLVYVCKNYACNLPTNDLDLIEKQLSNK